MSCFHINFVLHSTIVCMATVRRRCNRVMRLYTRACPAQISVARLCVYSGWLVLSRSWVPIVITLAITRCDGVKITKPLIVECQNVKKKQKKICKRRRRNDNTHSHLRWDGLERQRRRRRWHTTRTRTAIVDRIGILNTSGSVMRSI